MVTPEFSFSNSAIQASCAACWALEPAPAISPETLSPPLPLAVSSLLPPQAATPIARITAALSTTNHLELVNSFSFGSIHQLVPPSQRLPSTLLRGCVERVKKM